MNLICIWYSYNEIDVGWHLDLEKKQKIHRAAHFGTTHYVINMALICDGYEFDMYWYISNSYPSQIKSISITQWNICMMKSGFGEKVENKQISLIWYNRMCNWYGFDL